MILFEEHEGYTYILEWWDDVELQLVWYWIFSDNHTVTHGAYDFVKDARAYCVNTIDYWVKAYKGEA